MSEEERVHEEISFSKVGKLWRCAIAHQVGNLYGACGVGTGMTKKGAYDEARTNLTRMLFEAYQKYLNEGKYLTRGEILSREALDRMNRRQR